MEDEEVIRRRMEHTREALTEKLEALEKKVASSVSAVTDTVADVKEKMQEGVETVKDAVDVPAHVERHPWLMLGGSVLCGYVLGTLLEGRRPQAAPPRPVAPAADRNNGNGRHASEKPASTPTGESWLGAFEPEIQHLKGLALGVALGTVREMVSEQVPPHMAGQLREIIDAVTKKAGGAPIPSSDWHAAQPAPSPDAGPECSEVHAQNPRW